jgi:hypothetical protein
MAIGLGGLWLAPDRTRGAFVLVPTLVLSAALLFTRGGVRRLALPAVLLGALPLLCAVGAEKMGHVCSPGGCVSLCLPLCALGGSVAGALYGRAVHRLGASLADYGAGLVLLCGTGSVGCACMGLSSIAAMGAGAVVLSLTSLTVARVWGARSAADRS